MLNVNSSNEADIKSLKADMLELNKNFGMLKDLLVTGKGLQKNDNEIKPEEYKQFATARIEQASMQEIVDFLGKQ